VANLPLPVEHLEKTQIRLFTASGIQNISAHQWRIFVEVTYQHSAAQDTMDEAD
jgi:hypothetical protein